MFDRRTLSNSASFEGVAVHNGEFCTVKLIPTEEDSGITFVRTDIKGKNNKIIADFKNIEKTDYCTRLTNSDGVFVNTIEHLMSALWCFKICDLTIEIDNSELPIMDGSAKAFCFLIDSVGVKKYPSKRKTLKILKEIEIGNEEKFIRIRPLEDFVVTYNLYNKYDIIQDVSNYTFSRKTDSFVQNISQARTFCDFYDIEKMQYLGIIKGGNLENAIVVKDNTILNEHKKNYSNEFTRHKILDFIGDIALCDYDISGHFYCQNSGHAMNNDIMHKIFENDGNYELI